MSGVSYGTSHDVIALTSVLVRLSYQVVRGGTHNSPLVSW